MGEINWSLSIFKSAGVPQLETIQGAKLIFIKDQDVTAFLNILIIRSYLRMVNSGFCCG